MNHDVIVIGGGQAGWVSRAKASRYTASVAARHRARSRTLRAISVARPPGDGSAADGWLRLVVARRFRMAQG